jgi:hypothetical protein
MPATPLVLLLAPFAVVGFIASLALAWAARSVVLGTRGLVVVAI